mgnify:CR=1 FL=1
MRTVYYLTGMGGRLDHGLGKALADRGLDVVGRELVGEFRSMTFQDQVDLVVADLQTHFWHPEARVIANSFGAYLFLHAQLQMPPFGGKVVLLSPIVGEFSSEGSRTNFIPPRARKLFEVAESGSFPVPLQCEIHVGETDWQSNPASVCELGSKIGIPVSVVPEAGHMLPPAYVSKVLDRWLRDRKNEL